MIQEIAGLTFHIFGSDFFTRDKNFEVTTFENQIRLKQSLSKSGNRYIEIVGSIDNCNLFVITVTGWHYNKYKSKLDIINSVQSAFHIPVVDDDLIVMAHIKMIQGYKDILNSFR